MLTYRNFFAPLLIVALVTGIGYAALLALSNNTNVKALPTETQSAAVTKPTTQTETGLAEKNPAQSSANIPETVDTPKPTPALGLAQSIEFFQPTPTVPVVTIKPQSIVGIVCIFANSKSPEEKYYRKGSGVIISETGVVLTARHLVDLRFGLTSTSPKEAIDRANTFNREKCELGRVAGGATLPAPEDIRNINPSIRVPVLDLSATVLFIPQTYTVAKESIPWFDFVLLKIDSVTESGKQFGLTQLPTRFDYADLLNNDYPILDDDVISYGFPASTTDGKQGSFNTLYLNGAVGKMISLKDGGIILHTKMEVSEGRSGSPLFWRGHVAGIITAYEKGDRTESYALSANLIREVAGLK